MTRCSKCGRDDERLCIYNSADCPLYRARRKREESSDLTISLDSVVAIGVGMAMENLIHSSSSSSSSSSSDISGGGGDFGGGGSSGDY